MKQVEISRGYKPGMLADVTKLHMSYYAPKWGFGSVFETKVAGDMAEFLYRFNAERDLLVGAWDHDGTLLASVVIDGLTKDQEGAQLRWFVTLDRARGQGLGKELMAQAMAFCDDQGFHNTYLTTFKGLDAARSLYERHGFVLTAETKTDPWGGTVGLQRFDRKMPGSSG